MDPKSIGLWPARVRFPSVSKECEWLHTLRALLLPRGSLRSAALHGRSSFARVRASLELLWQTSHRRPPSIGNWVTAARLVFMRELALLPTEGVQGGRRRVIKAFRASHRPCKLRIVSRMRLLARNAQSSDVEIGWLGFRLWMGGAATQGLGSFRLLHTAIRGPIPFTRLLRSGLK